MLNKQHCVIGIICLLLQTTVLADALPNSLSTLPLSNQQITKFEALLKPGITKNNNDALSDFANTGEEHVIWDATPITVTLPVGKERIIKFPEPIAFGYAPKMLPMNVLQVQNNAGVLYLKAQSAFTAQRVAVKCINSGKIILLDLSAQASTDDTPLVVIMAENTKTNALNAENKNGNKNNTFDLERNLEVENNNNPISADNLFNQNLSPDNTVNAITLTRFAAQQLYAPKRLLTEPNNIFRTPMHTHKTVPLLLDGSAMAMPLASWRSGDLTVTAVLLRNQLNQSLPLDARNLCGTWQTASFFPQQTLAPHNQANDSTTVFLIAQGNFADGFKECY
jgi:integrating conjugative element protein (TIGR03749 family)